MVSTGDSRTPGRTLGFLQQPKMPSKTEIIKRAIDPIRKRMEKKWVKIHKIEREQIAAYKLEMERLERERLDHLKILRRAEGYKDTVGEKQQELTLVAAQLADDKAYLAQMTETCNAKAKEWDQRSGMRAGEITALTSALTVLKGYVAGKVTSRTVRLLDNRGGKEIRANVA